MGIPCTLGRAQARIEVPSNFPLTGEILGGDANENTELLFVGNIDVMNETYRDLVIALAIFFFGGIFSLVLARVTRVTLGRFTERTKSQTDDFLLISNKRLIERKQSNLQWEYNIIHISDINQIKIKKGLDLNKIIFGFLGLIISYPLMNLIENTIVATILFILSITCGTIILINQLAFLHSIKLELTDNKTNKKINFSYNLRKNILSKLNQLIAENKKSNL